MLSRRDEFGYDVGVPVSWAPARPQFAPGIFLFSKDYLIKSEI